MKYLLFIFTFYSFITLNAQSVTTGLPRDTIRTGLTREEFQKAVKMYEAMLKSDIYIKIQKNVEESAEMRNHLPLPYLSTSGDVNEYNRETKKWYEDNLSKTKYKTVEEAMNAESEGATLCSKMLDQYKELFLLTARATKEQALAIMEPERKRAFDSLYEKKN